MTAQVAALPGDLVSGTAADHWSQQVAHEVLRRSPAAVTTGLATRVLRPDGHAVGEARRFTRSTLRNWQCGALVDDLAVIVSELLSNAMRHGLCVQRERRAPAGPVRLGLLRRGRTVLCAVCDHSNRVPVLREPDFLAESGRGLHIVASLSDAWGWTAPSAAGKAVWATVSAPA
jgi:anti-sigma regulatory factor (Ser/Thr protein kinase)